MRWRCLATLPHTPETPNLQQEIVMTKKWIFGILGILTLLTGIGLWQLTNYYLNLPNNLSQHETLVFGNTQFVPDSTGAIRVLVRDTSTANPLPDAEITVSLSGDAKDAELELFSGTTDASGSANVNFKVPVGWNENQRLIVKTVSSLGTDTLERDVTIKRDYKVLLSTDKPLYQPGQVIHLRALALSTFDLVPAANQSLELIIADGKGNKVYRETLTTDAYGVAFADFQLATQVNTGAYKITAQLTNADGRSTTLSEKTVTVERYQLPKFDLNLQTDRPYYQPGDIVRGTLNATYFFGKPVSEGALTLTGYTFDFERTDTFTVEAVTDANGDYAFEFTLPDYFAGAEVNSGNARFYLQASVTDQAAANETKSLSFPVSNNGLTIQAIIEGGTVKRGLENILYVMTSYPDGSPAQATLKLTDYGFSNDLPASIETSEFGLAEVRFTPTETYFETEIVAVAENGALSTLYYSAEGDWTAYNNSVLMRPDRPAYKVGDTMTLDIFTTQPNGTVYVDLIREGQTLSTRSVAVENGKAQLPVDLSQDMFGTLQISAYKVLQDGNIARDTRLVVIDQQDTLAIEFAPDQAEYRPGDTANLGIQVSDADGNGAQAALGLAVVDESVFALAEQDPGFAKLYFMLEQELLKPKYDLHGLTLPELAQPIPLDNDLQFAAQEAAAHASLAESTNFYDSGFSLQANSRQENIAKAYEQQERFFARAATTSFWLSGGLGIFALALMVLLTRRISKVGRNIGIAIGLLIGVMLLLTGLFSLLRNTNNWWRFQYETLPVVLILLSGLGLLLLIVNAFREKERLLSGFMLAALIGIVVFAYGVFASTEGYFSPSATLGWWLGIALGCVLLALLLHTVNQAYRKQILGVIAAGLLAFTGLSAIAVAAAEVGVGAGGGREFADGDVMEMAVAMDMEFAEEEAMDDSGEVSLPGPSLQKADTATANNAPRIRQYFPETMYWLPDGVTDESGALNLEVPVADSITTWRLTALASTQDGQMGSAQGSLRVFQDFFIDLDLPLSLTVGDEIAVPVGVFNYLEDAQTVTLTVKEEDWFELLDDSEKQITIGANDIDVVYFRIRAKQFGSQPFEVTAIGSTMSDAILKRVRVYPNGMEVRTTASDKLNPEATVTQQLTLPAESIPGTQQVTVKIYPGVTSQIVEGLDSILRMPSGCFEQTSSTTYPNVLVLDYLRSSGQAAPEIELKAEEFINLGYQRLTTFEVQETNGGFSLFGDPPPDRMLTAYGLQEFADMARVHDVDPELLSRAVTWLATQQNSDGSWENDQGLVHEGSLASLNSNVPVTAYITWSMIDAGYLDTDTAQSGLAYIRKNYGQTDDPYATALIANALVSADLAANAALSSETTAILDKLASQATLEGNGAIWSSGVATFMGSEGITGSIETTALAAFAFLRADTHPELANAALVALVQNKDSFGTWYSTQATVLSLKALLESVRSGSEEVDATVTIALNGQQTETVTVSAENFDVVQYITFDNLNPNENTLELTMSGSGNLMYQVVGEYYLPWDVVPQYADVVGQDISQELVTVDVTYDRAELNVDDTVGVDVQVALNEPGASVENALIDLGIPPGFSVETDDLNALIASQGQLPKDGSVAVIERYELTGRQVILYISDLQAGTPVDFSYRLRAKYPVKVQTPSSNAYDYYNPDVNGVDAPQTLTVNEG